MHIRIYYLISIISVYVDEYNCNFAARASLNLLHPPNFPEGLVGNALAIKSADIQKCMKL